jgi:hypothetical protein
MEGIETFTKIRDVCDDIIKAYESEDEKELESAMGRFILLCIQMQALK